MSALEDKILALLCTGRRPLLLKEVVDAKSIWSGTDPSDDDARRSLASATLANLCAQSLLHKRCVRNVDVYWLNDAAYVAKLSKPPAPPQITPENSPEEEKDAPPEEPPMKRPRMDDSPPEPAPAVIEPAPVSESAAVKENNPPPNAEPNDKDPVVEQLREKLDSVSRELQELSAEYSEAELNVHIDKLHDYNDIKDLGQMLLGKLAEVQELTTKAMYVKFGLEFED